VIAKETDGTVKRLNVTDLGDEYIVDFAQSHNLKDVVSEEDISEVADLIVEDSSAGILVIEHLWAKPLKKAIIDANGYLIADGRIHPEAALELAQEGE